MFPQRLKIFYIPQNINSENAFIHQSSRNKARALSLPMVKNPQLDY